MHVAWQVSMLKILHFANSANLKNLNRRVKWPSFIRVQMIKNHYLKLLMKHTLLAELIKYKVPLHQKINCMKIGIFKF